MLWLVLRGLVAHRARLAATAAAVVIGVAFVAGTYVLTDTLRTAITQVAGQSPPGVAVVVQARSAISGSGGSAFGNNGLTVPQSTVARVAAVPGVAAADGLAVGSVEVLGPNGRALSNVTSLQLAFSVGRVPQLRFLTLRQGRLPTQPDQAVLDVTSSTQFHIRVGQRVRVAGAGTARTVRVVGLVGYGTADSLAGATIVGLTLPTTQAVLGQPGRIYEVAVSAVPGVSSAQLAARVSDALGHGYEVRTQQQAIAAAASSIDKGFAVFSDVLLVFAGVALFVAAFLIFNTFSILLAQRSRELALLRCLGALRRQLVAMVVLESAAVGLVASAVGLGLGVLLALGLRSLLSSAGVGLPAATPVVALCTVVVSLVVGTVATVAAALLPALRGARTAPVAALRDEPAVDTGRLRRRPGSSAVSCWWPWGCSWWSSPFTPGAVGPGTPPIAPRWPGSASSWASSGWLPWCPSWLARWRA